MKQVLKKYTPKILIIFYHNVKDICLYFRYYYKRKKYRKKYQILIDDDMVTSILEGKKSLCRFGDGEFRWMINIPHVSFELYSEEMAERLKKVLTSNDERILIAIPRTINSAIYCNRKPRMFWDTFWGKYGNEINRYLSIDKIYGDTELTRPYMDYKDKSKAGYRFEIVKLLWSNRSIVIIEGEKTKLGVGNDLFSNVKSIKRILCPNANAFSRYDIILNIAEKYAFKDVLYLIALGPTATILAYDLGKKGYQAMDIGHIDIEYEWYLKGAQKKTAVIGKSMTEGCSEDLSNFVETDNEYLQSIVEHIY